MSTPAGAEPFTTPQPERRTRCRCAHDAVCDPRSRDRTVRPVLAIAAVKMDRADARRAEPLNPGRGHLRRTDQALDEADLLARSSTMPDSSPCRDGRRDDAALVAHCAAVGSRIPLVGFYLQSSGVAGAVVRLRRRFAEITRRCRHQDRSVTAIRPSTSSGRHRCPRDDIALYTGNDDAIVADLVTPFRFATDGRIVERRNRRRPSCHWAVWTRTPCRCSTSVRRRRTPHGFRCAAATWSGDTDANAAFFDAAHGFAGCIAGIQECCDGRGWYAAPGVLSAHDVRHPRQAAEIDRVCPRLSATRG